MMNCEKPMVRQQHICHPMPRTNSWVAAAGPCRRGVNAAGHCQRCSNLSTSAQHVHMASSWCSTRTLAAASSQLKVSPTTQARTALPFMQQQKQRCRSPASSVIVHATTNSSSCVTGELIHTTWTSPDGTLFEVLEMHSQHDNSSSSSSSGRPPVVLVHGLFRAAWYWSESLMPVLAAAGHDCYALSLRGQGNSQLYPQAAQQQTAAAAPASEAYAHGVPLAVNVADIAAFICSRSFTQPPVLVGHSLGGMFVQEYLHCLHRQQHAQPTATATTTSSGSSDGSTAAAVPGLSGAVLLGSACAGTVMSFGRFIADVGLPEFLYQMYIVFSCAHLNDLATARYCWWGDDMDDDEAARYLAAIRASSSVLPYVTKEVGAWRPPAPSPAARQLLPPVLALGGEADRIIRPFQVCAAGDYWGAEVVVLPGVTHDMLLGPQAAAVSQQLLSWLQRVPAAAAAAASSGASVGGAVSSFREEQMLPVGNSDAQTVPQVLSTQ